MCIRDSHEPLYRQSVHNNSRVNCCEPIDDKEAHGDDRLIDFTSGYFERGLSQMPKQGNKAPWKNYQNYLKDIFAVRIFSIKDSNLSFYNNKQN